MNARQIFAREYGTSKNFMTPHRIRVGSIARGRVAYELSSGQGMRPHSTIYGVTVCAYDAATDKTWRCYDLGRSCSSLDAAERYITSLQFNASFTDDVNELARMMGES